MIYEYIYDAEITGNDWIKWHFSVVEQDGIMIDIRRWDYGQKRNSFRPTIRGSRVQFDLLKPFFKMVLEKYGNCKVIENSE